MSHRSSSPSSLDQVDDDPELQEWPEEVLASTVSSHTSSQGQVSDNMKLLGFFMVFVYQHLTSRIDNLYNLHEWLEDLKPTDSNLTSSPDQVGDRPKLRARPKVDLASTPIHVSLPNQVSRRQKSIEWPEEDLTSTAEEGGGFYPLRLGETFEDGRFVITRKLGWGGNSSVWLARDRKDNRHVALKVLSSYASKEIKAGRLRERDILRKVANTAPLHHGFQHVVHLLDEFTFESFAGQHVCFATNILSYSVPDLQSHLDEDPRLPLKLILRITKHVLKGLEYLHDKCEVVHSDLKPANILLLPPDIDDLVMRELSERPAKIYGFPKTIPPDELPVPPVMSAPLHFIADGPMLHWVIADLGHAHLQRELLSDIVQPYALRAPEVILGLEWGPAIDIWSLGCMMYEFATGHWLFKPEATGDISRDVSHLAQMTQRTGQDHDDVTLKQYEIRKKQDDLKGMLRRAALEGTKFASIESALNESTTRSNGAEEVAAFVRIMLSFLALDPAQRPRAAEALLDPAFERFL